jgi:hypothetical protein
MLRLLFAVAYGAAVVPSVATVMTVVIVVADVALQFGSCCNRLQLTLLVKKTQRGLRTFFTKYVKRREFRKILHGMGV